MLAWLKPGRRRWVVSLVVLLGLLALLWQPFLLGVAAFMTVSSPVEKADFILPLYDDFDSVSAGVADLYRRQLAPRVVLYRMKPTRLEELSLVEPPHQVWGKLLEAKGVPPDAIEIIGSDVEDEVQLGNALSGLARDAGRIRLIVVVSGPRSRIARNALGRGLDGANVDLRMFPVTPPDIDERAWWRSRPGWIAYFDAYCLWLISFFR